MVIAETYTPNQLYSVPLAELQADPNQPRKYLDSQALEELTASVVQHGILEPILFRQEDPNVPKKVLIGLAKNKQQRSMISQYQKYRKAQAKAAAPNTRTTAKTSP
ncbi:MAG: ParB N-terminal domain-containing protein, partial [Deltaproteobacteria bacterium]|nr:ParB N-terminal domain-containing protein [Deltaproteobacteria bacterium]